MFNCVSFQKSIDISGLKDTSARIKNNFNPGSPEQLENFINEFSLVEHTKPLYSDKDIKIKPRNNWKIKDKSIRDLIYEKITFPSLIKHQEKQDTAVFYIYRMGEIGERDFILWVPGMGVSDLAFLFIKNFFKEQLKRNYDIAVYIPPYHMERTEKNKANGEGFFTADTLHNLKVVLNSIRELRTFMNYLRNKGVDNISGWGGSTGASMLLLISQFDKFEHLSLMIPLLNWTKVFLENKATVEVPAKLVKYGYSYSMLKKAYYLISPVNYNVININPDNMLIQYAEYDQLTPSELTRNYARKHNIKNIIAYKRSHSTILLTSKLYRDYGIFLDSLRDSN